MSQILDQLRTLPTMVGNPGVESFYPFSFLPQGVPQGALIELSGGWGSGKTEVVLRFLSENRNLNVAWIEKSFTLNPGCFPSYSIDENRLLLIHAQTSSLGVVSALQIIKSQAFPVIVLSHLELTVLELRRLQLLARQSKSTVILLSLKPRLEGRWPIFIQAGVKRCKFSNQLYVEVLE